MIFMSAVTQTLHSEEEYLIMEEKSDYKSEYFKGEIFMMAGATPDQRKSIHRNWISSQKEKVLSQLFQRSANSHS